MKFLAQAYTDTDDFIKKVDELSPDPGTILICPVLVDSSHVENFEKLKELIRRHLCRMIIGPFQGKTYFINETGQNLKIINQCHFLGGEGNCGNNTPATITIEGVNLGIFMNDDLIFPELARTLCLAGTEIMIYLCNEPLPIWESISRTRSFENGTPLLAASGTGIFFWAGYDGSINGEFKNFKRPSQVKWKKQLFSHRQAQSYRILTLHIES